MSRERALRLVTAASAFSSSILLIFGHTTINAKSMLGFLSIGGMPERVMTLQTDGEDETEALEAMRLALEKE